MGSNMKSKAIPLSVLESVLPPEQATNYRLVRKKDKLIAESQAVLWFEWGLDGKFESLHEEPEIGRSLIMSPFNQFFTWLTTPITEIVKQKEGYIKFKTKNSTYELFKL
jgi:hypothetical protein